VSDSMENPQPITLGKVGRLALGAVVIGLLFVGAGMLLAHASDSWTRTDGAVDRWFVAHRVAAWNSVTLVASDMAQTMTVVAVAAVSFFVLRLWLGRWHESFVLAIALAGEVLIFLTVTAVVQRPRPDVPRLDEAPPTSSFPSGHTAAAVTVYGFLAYVIWRYAASRVFAGLACAVLILVPVAVGLARLYRGAHYPTDVLGGALLGLVWLSLVVKTLLPRPSDPVHDRGPERAQLAT